MKIKFAVLAVSSAIVLSMLSGCGSRAASGGANVSHAGSGAVSQSSVISQDTSSQIFELNHRIAELENAFDRNAPEKVAELYGKAVKTRNGALEFALYSDGLRAKTIDNLNSCDWHTGVSDPYVSGYKVVGVKTENSNTATADITFEHVSGGKSAGSTTSRIYMSGTENIWYITKIDNGK